jgi:hypothetical protein
MSDSDMTDRLPDPDTSLDLDKLLEQNPDVDAKQIREVRAFIKARRGAGGRGKTYEIDSPYERRPIPGPESARRRLN